MKIQFYLLGFIITALLSCEFSENENSHEADKSDFEEMSGIKAETYKNIQVIDEVYCKKYNYPITSFAIEYPDNVEIILHENEYSYVYFKVKEDNEIIEELSIGYTTLTIPFKSKSTGLLEDLIKKFEAQLDLFHTDFIGKSKFKGKLEYLFNGYADYSSYKEMGYDGKYRIIMMIPFPEKNDKINAVIVSFIANEKSGIKSYSDFQKKGVISKIWDTFRYIE